MQEKIEPLGVDVTRAADLLGLGVALTWRLCYSGRLQSFKIGRRRIVPMAGIRALIAQGLAEGQIAA
jgi:hypothetical protein